MRCWLRKMKNEAYQAILKRFEKKDGLTLHLYGSDASATSFANLLENGAIYLGDAPDMFIKLGNHALIIEHFEYDGYHVRKGKGSSGRQKLKIIEENAKKGDGFYSGIINAKSSLGDLLTNIARSFEQHYSHIPLYKGNLMEHALIDDHTEVKTLFLLEDTSPLGTLFSGANEFNPDICYFMPALSNEFLDILQSHPDVDYILNFSNAGGKDVAWFIDSNELDAFREHTVDYSNMLFYPSEAHVILGKKCVSRSEINNEKI